MWVIFTQSVQGSTKPDLFVRSELAMTLYQKLRISNYRLCTRLVNSLLMASPFSEGFNENKLFSDAYIHDFMIFSNVSVLTNVLSGLRVSESKSEQKSLFSINLKSS